MLTDKSVELLADPEKISGSDLTDTSRKIFIDVDAFPEELFVAPDTIPRFK